MIMKIDSPHIYHILGDFYSDQRDIKIIWNAFQTYRLVKFY